MGDAAPDDPELALQLRRACAELIRQLRAGKDARSETFLASFAACTQDVDSAIELIYTEFATREELGQGPRAEEFYARFPDLAGALRRQFEIHTIIGGAVDEPGDLARLAAGRPQQPAAPRDESAASEPQIGGFRVLAEMARGGMGVVYKAQHCELGRVVALKRLPGMLGAGAIGSHVLARFRDEARVMAALRHPNIVQIDEIGEDADGRPFLVCEFVDGGSLAEQLTAGAGTPRQAALLVRTLAEAVDCAHRLGILHCDLSPANVLLTADGTPKIADFGLARLRRDSATSDRASAIAGTPAYMAPEQWTQAEELTPATDVYALGAILYELLTGRPPFCGATAWDTLRMASALEPTAPSLIRPEIGRDLEAICLKCLAKSPRQRYPSAAHLADDIDRLLAGEPVAARPIGMAERMAKTARRRPLAATALAIALATTTALIVGGWRYNTLLFRALTHTEQQQHQIQKQAVELAAQLDVSRRNVYAMQLNQAESLLDDAPQRSAEMLRDARRCPADLRDFAWGLLYHRAAQDRQTLEPGDVQIETLLIPDASTVVGLDRTGKVLRWQSSTGHLAARVGLPVSKFTCAALASDGRLAALAGEDHAIYICNVDRSPADVILRGHRERITALAISNNREQLLSGSHDGEVRLWDIGNRGATQLCAPSGVAVAGLAFGSGGQRLAMADAEGVLRVWATPELKPVTEIRTQHAGVLGVALAPDDDTLVVGALWDGRIDVWNLKDERLRGSLKTEDTLLKAMTVSPDRKLLAVAGADQTIRIWNLKTMSGGEVFRRQASQIDCLAFSGDSNVLASADQEANVKLWDVGQSPSPRLLATSSARILATAFSPHGECLATAGFDPVVHVWDTASGRQRFALEGHECAVRALRYSKTGKFLASAGEDGAVRLWDTQTGKQYAQWLHPCWVTDVAFSPDERLAVTAASDGRIRLWGVEPGADHPLVELGEHRGAVQVVSFSPSGRWLATAGRDGGVVLWDVFDRRRLATLAGHKGSVVTAAFAPDGRSLASAGEDMQIRLWDVETHTQVAVLSGHTQPISSLVFTRDGRTLISGTGDRWVSVPGEVKLWDVRTGHLHATLHDHGAPLALAADCALLATSQDDSVWIWQTAPFDTGVAAKASIRGPQP